MQWWWPPWAGCGTSCRLCSSASWCATLSYINIIAIFHIYSVVLTGGTSAELRLAEAAEPDLVRPPPPPRPATPPLLDHDFTSQVPRNLYKWDLDLFIAYCQSRHPRHPREANLGKTLRQGNEHSALRPEDRQMRPAASLESELLSLVRG